MFLSEVKKQASSFLQDKYKAARLALTDVTQAQLLAEEATNSDSWGPDAKTMTRVSDAAHDTDDYWRIVDVLHMRLHCVNWKEWRQSYKALVLLEFLLTHGPEGMSKEFNCDVSVIAELEKFNYIDERGFNWGACMKNKSQRILKLLSDEDQLKEARLKAMKISNEIRGFGNLLFASPSSTSSPSSSSSRASGSSSLSSYFWDSTSPSWSAEKLSDDDDDDDDDVHEGTPKKASTMLDKQMEEGLHLWDAHAHAPAEEKSSLILGETGSDSLLQSTSWKSGICSRFFGDKRSSFSSTSSDVGTGKARKKIHRQVSTRF